MDERTSYIVDTKPGEPQVPAKKGGPKDVFLHLLAIITLYFSAGSFIALLFQYINIFLPDPLIEGGNYYAREGYIGVIRFAISSLIIVFPVYIITSWYLNKVYLTMPFKRELRSRRWLIYFTLFATVLIIIGDLVALVYGFLGGWELTVRFVLKALTVLFVAASIFFYYFTDMRKHHTE